MKPWETVVDFDTLYALRALLAAGIPPDSCFDYVDALVQDPERGYGVVCFLEPAGDAVYWATSWAEACRWWLKTFEAQPRSMSYVEAGFLLEEWCRNKHHDSSLPDFEWPSG